MVGEGKPTPGDFRFLGSGRCRRRNASRGMPGMSSPRLPGQFLCCKEGSNSAPYRLRCSGRSNRMGCPDGWARGQMLGPSARGDGMGTEGSGGQRGRASQGGTMTPAIVYSRWSPRPNAEDCLSIETQLDRCRAFCQGNEYEIVQDYQEPNVSGDDCRPELEKAIEHAKRLRAVLVVYKLDRAA